MARTGRKSTVKFKLCKELVILVAFIVAMIVTTIVLSIPSQSTKDLEEMNNAILIYNQTNSTSYATLGEDNVYSKAELGDIKKAISKTSDGTEENAEYVYVLYGSLNQATILQYLSVIDTEAKQREVEVVYLYSSNKVENQEDLTDEEFVASLDKDEEVFNGENDELLAAGVEAVDLTVYPTLLVYKNGELIFNSTTVIEDGSYNWTLLISHAFSL